MTVGPGVALELVQERERPLACVRRVGETVLGGVRVPCVGGADKPERAQERSVHVRNRPPS